MLNVGTEDWALNGVLVQVLGVLKGVLGSNEIGCLEPPCGPSGLGGCLTYPFSINVN